VLISNWLRAASAAVITGVAAVALTVSATAAEASPSAPAGAQRVVSPHSPLQAEGCTGDSCINLGDPWADGVVQVRGCAWKTGFWGHIEITGPNGFLRNSVTEQYNSTVHYCTGGDHAYIVDAPGAKGEYCVTGWRDYGGGHYQNLGAACEWVE
jgi:hypothetical protein